MPQRRIAWQNAVDGIAAVGDMRPKMLAQVPMMANQRVEISAKS